MPASWNSSYTDVKDAPASPLAAAESERALMQRLHKPIWESLELLRAVYFNKARRGKHRPSGWCRINLTHHLVRNQNERIQVVLCRLVPDAS